MMIVIVIVDNMIQQVGSLHSALLVQPPNLCVELNYHFRFMQTDFYSKKPGVESQTLERYMSSKPIPDQKQHRKYDDNINFSRAAITVPVCRLHRDLLRAAPPCCDDGSVFCSSSSSELSTQFFSPVMQLLQATGGFETCDDAVPET